MGNRWGSWAELQSCGSSGGILVLWDKRFWSCVDVQVGTFSISCRFEHLYEDFKFVFTGVYGPHTNPERAKLWQELAAIRGLWPEQWVIGGDLNVCRFVNERLNCSRISWTMTGFSDFIQDLELVDLPLHGAQYT